MRRTASTAILAVLALSLLACRTEQPNKQAETRDSSRPASEAEPPVATLQPSPAAANDKRPLIVCFGDSLTAGYGTELDKSYPDYLQADLDALGYHYRVVNQGISGNTTKDGVERVDGIVAMKPAVVVVEFGGNDGLRGFRIEDSRANLDKIVATLQASGTKVVLAGITLPPDYGPDYIQPVQRNLRPARQKIQRPIAPIPPEGRLRRRRHDAARQHPRNRRR